MNNGQKGKKANLHTIKSNLTKFFLTSENYHTYQSPHGDVSYMNDACLATKVLLLYLDYSSTLPQAKFPQVASSIWDILWPGI